MRPSWIPPSIVTTANICVGRGVNNRGRARSPFRDSNAVRTQVQSIWHIRCIFGRHKPPSYQKQQRGQIGLTNCAGRTFPVEPLVPAALTSSVPSSTVARNWLFAFVFTMVGSFLAELGSIWRALLITGSGISCRSAQRMR